MKAGRNLMMISYVYFNVTCIHRVLMLIHWNDQQNIYIFTIKVIIEKKSQMQQ